MKKGLLFSFFCLSLGLSPTLAQNPDSLSRPPKIQIALLLDVSGSMNGLIAQAQAQLWTMVNQLSDLQKEGQKPEIEFGVITFGNDDLAETAHIQLVASFTNDLDLISEQLFLLEVTGSNEHCGAALQTAMDSLNWSKDTSALMMIMIAGNESFDQGEVDYAAICHKIAKHHIFVNTVYCGDLVEGIEMQWESAAQIGTGQYVNIEQDLAIEQLETPYDGKIIDLYQQYKATHLFFGPDHLEKTNRYHNQDINAYQISNAYFRDRIIYKIKQDDHFDQWDLIDRFEENTDFLEEITPDDLPENLRQQPKKEIRKLLIQNQYKRQIIIEAISLYAEKVEAFLKINQKDKEEEKTLDDVLRYIVKKQAKKKGFLHP